jgi:predicted O-methyltransferase YrrM
MISSKLEYHFKNIENILTEIGERVEGNLICDIRPDNYVSKRNESKILNIQKLSLGKKYICEIGLNAGHSLLIMLENNPTAEYLVFDLNIHKYTEHCLWYIKEQYPGTKITSVFGDSRFTMMEYISKNSNEYNKYELIHIDGGHDTDVVISDFNNCKLLSAKNGITIFDDYDYQNIKDVIDNKLFSEEIEPVDDLELVKTDLHFIYKLK